MDFYVILGLERGATPNDIKRAYKRLARRLHPDINPGDGTAAARFRQVLQAYETLIDPDRRRRYDTEGAVVATGESVAFGFDGFDFSVSVSGNATPTFGDLFGDVLRQRDRQPDQSAERGADLHDTATLTLEETLQGTRRELKVLRRQACRQCAGAGRIAAPESRCLQCQGTGIIRSARGHMVFSRPCMRCRGTGHLADALCPACHGLQTEPLSETVAVNFPAGLADSARVRVAGKGHAGRNGGEPGDLLVTVRVEPHPVFRRDGDDLHTIVGVAVHEAALGARIDLPVLDGAVRLRVPPGTQSGQRFRLRERGVPRRDGRRGDLIVEVRITLPSILDERSKELLREFGRINGDIRQLTTKDTKDTKNG
jgi:molecular chaperone DnaJ